MRLRGIGIFGPFRPRRLNGIGLAIPHQLIDRAANPIKQGGRVCRRVLDSSNAH
jgi:hypothetical protein